jgi:hypothetical protein
VINVYGSVRKELKRRFMQEWYQKIQINIGPLVVGRDFDMIRYPHEKNTGSENTI